MRYLLSLLAVAVFLSITVSLPAYADYYVIWRYVCVDVNSGNDAGDCEITTRSQNSCQEAINAQQSQVAAVGGEPCVVCGNVTDNSKRWTKVINKVTGGGQCQGM